MKPATNVKSQPLYYPEGRGKKVWVDRTWCGQYRRPGLSRLRMQFWGMEQAADEIDQARRATLYGELGT